MHYLTVFFGWTSCGLTVEVEQTFFILSYCIFMHYLMLYFRDFAVEALVE